MTRSQFYIFNFFPGFFFQFIFHCVMIGRYTPNFWENCQSRCRRSYFSLRKPLLIRKKKLYLLNCKPQQSIFALFFCCCWHYGSHQFIGLPNTEKSAIKMIWEQVVASKFFFFNFPSHYFSKMIILTFYGRLCWDQKKLAMIFPSKLLQHVEQTRAGQSNQLWANNWEWLTHSLLDLNALTLNVRLP